MSDQVQIFKSDKLKLSVSKFGQISDPCSHQEQECIPIEKYTWETANRLTLEVITLDAAIVGLRIPDRDFKSEEVILGAAETLQQYLHYAEQDLSSSIQSVPLRRRRSGSSGWSQRIWSPYVNGSDLVLTNVVVDECRNLMINVTFSVLFNNVVRIAYQVVSDRGQVLETTHRMVLNLAGRMAGHFGTYDHVMQMNAEWFHEVKGNRLKGSTDVERSVAEDLADLRVAQHIGMAIYRSERKGFDGAYKLPERNDDQRRFDMRLIQARAGRVMEVYSDFKWSRFSTLNDLPDPEGTIAPFYASLGVKHIGQIFDMEELIRSVVRLIEGDDEEEEESISVQDSATVNESEIRIMIDDLLLSNLEAKIRELKEAGILSAQEARAIIENLLLMSLDQLSEAMAESDSQIEANIGDVIKDLVGRCISKTSSAKISQILSESFGVSKEEGIAGSISLETSNEEVQDEVSYHEYRKHAGIVLQFSETPFLKRCKQKSVFSQPNLTKQQGITYNHSVLLKFGLCNATPNRNNNGSNKSDVSI